MSYKIIDGKTPGEVRLVSLADAHVSPTTPPSIKVDYWEHTVETIQQVINFAIKNQVDALLWPGDLFHKKSPDANPIWFVTAVTKLIKCGIPSLVIGGNHDLKYGSLKGLPGQPLNLLIESGILHLLDDNPVHFVTDGLVVRVAGKSYDHGRADDYLKLEKDCATRLVTLGHFWYGPASGEFMGEPMYGPDTLCKSQADVHVIGHHHEDQGVLKQDGKWYVCAGAINRTGAHKGDLQRRPAAPYVRITPAGIEVRVLRPKVKMGADYFDEERREQILKEEREMEDFVQSLKGTEIKTDDPYQVLKDQEIGQEIKDRAKAYLEQAERATN